MAVHQTYRGAAIAGKPAPTGTAADHNICFHRRSLWESACRRWRCDRHTEVQQSLASQLPQELRPITTSASTADPCGSRLAGDGGGSDIPRCSNRWQASSHRNCGRSQHLLPPQIPVGVGLPAMAVHQTYRGAAIAGKPAPTGTAADHNICFHRRSLSESACRRWRCDRHTAVQQSLASQLPQELRPITTSASTADPCGSWLASDGGGSGTRDRDDPDHPINAARSSTENSAPGPSAGRRRILRT